MSKFNTKTSTPTTTSYEGGAVYEKTLEDEWINFLFSSLMGDGFYESAEKQQERYIELTKAMLEKHGFDFAAKASVFARQEIGLRSISTLTAAMLNDAKSENKRAYFRNFFHRPDDVAECFAAVDMLGSKRSHALVRGAGDYLSTLGEYQIDKYKMSGSEYNMYDLINISHANSDAINAYKAGTLTKADTWEQKISASKSVEEKDDNWKELVEGEKLGYLALLRNLRNICATKWATTEWLEWYVVPQLTNEKKIRKSLVFPYQIYSAYKNIPQCPIPIVVALDKAFRIAVGNMPELAGNSLVVLDVSGSMDSPVSNNSTMRIKEVGAVYGAAIYLMNPNSEFIKFGDKAKFVNYNRNSNIFEVIRNMQANDGLGYGTEIHSVWNRLNKHYDRIFLISDMQVMNAGIYSWSYYCGRGGRKDTSIDLMNKYFAEYGQSQIYSFDLGNYHTQISNPNSNNLHYITAMNDQVFKFIALLERGESIVDYINENYSYM